MTIQVRPATGNDTDTVVDLQIALFEEDAGTHDTTVDLGWPRREGHRDIEALIAGEETTIFVATADGPVVGFLAGYVADSSETRLPMQRAVIRSLFVDPAHRRLGVAAALCTSFIEWGRERGCREVTVDHYATNSGAARLYAELGFAEQSISRVLELG